MPAWRALLAAGAVGAVAPHFLGVVFMSKAPATSSAAWCWKVDASAEGGIIQNDDKKDWPPTHAWYNNKNKCCAEGETEENPSYVCFKQEECAELTDAFDNALKDIPKGDPKRPASCSGDADAAPAPAPAPAASPAAAPAASADASSGAGLGVPHTGLMLLGLMLQ